MPRSLCSRQCGKWARFYPLDGSPPLCRRCYRRATRPDRKRLRDFGIREDDRLRRTAHIRALLRLARRPTNRYAMAHWLHGVRPESPRRPPSLFFPPEPAALPKPWREGWWGDAAFGGRK